MSEPNYWIVDDDGEVIDFGVGGHVTLDDAIEEAESPTVRQPRLMVVSRSDFVCWTAATGKTGLV